MLHPILPRKSDYQDMFNIKGQNMNFVHLITNCHQSFGKNWSEKYKLSHYTIALYHWDAMTMKHFYGKSFYKKKMLERRQRGFVVHENISTNMHFHAWLDLGDLPIDEYRVVADKNWHSIVPSGDVKVDYGTDGCGAVRYMTKTKSLSDLQGLGGFHCLPTPTKLSVL